MTDFTIIYERYFKDVYRFIYSLCGNESVAEEITQETFFKALKNIDSYQGSCQMKVWLCQIAKNTFYSYQSKHARLSYWTGQEDKLHSLDRSLDEAFAYKEDALRIHKVLHTMKEPYKEVFMLRIFGELSFAEISQLFDKTESWARVTFYRAKQLIHKKLKEDERIE